MALPRSFRTPVLLLVLAATLGFSDITRSIALAVLRLPFTILSSGVRIILTLPRLPSLASDTAQLRATVVRQQLEVARLQEALRQVRQEHVLLEALPSTQGVVAPIISRSLLPTQQTAILGKGRRQGLTVGGVVLTAEGIVGRIIDVQPETAVVLLLTDADSRVAGVIERSRETGLLTGRGDGTLELAYVDADADIVAGDVLVTAGLGGAFPKGLPLGSVVRVVKEASAGIAHIRVRSAARLGAVEDVLCLPPAAESQP
ncbi:MAG: rod shape-determining protein MreC [Candidatus Omnitrophica bacterium]|nr:rod shape-determining protein MreC [Candidatus Omnitrophota bacterium]